MATFCIPSERAEYAARCKAEATRLAEIATVLTEFAFHELALACSLESSHLFDRAAQAISTLGVEGLLAA